jgi:hypothetical protein
MMDAIEIAITVVVVLCVFAVVAVLNVSTQPQEDVGFGCTECSFCADDWNYYADGTECSMRISDNITLTTDACIMFMQNWGNQTEVSS